MIKLLTCLTAATLAGIIFMIWEAIVAIPYNLLMYVKFKLIPSYKEIVQNYKDSK